jgi:hypothetical protein
MGRSPAPPVPRQINPCLRAREAEWAFLAPMLRMACDPREAGSIAVVGASACKKADGVKPPEDP